MITVTVTAADHADLQKHLAELLKKGGGEAHVGPSMVFEGDLRGGDFEGSPIDHDHDGNPMLWLVGQPGTGENMTILTSKVLRPCLEKLGLQTGGPHRLRLTIEVRP